MMTFRTEIKLRFLCDNGFEAISAPYEFLMDFKGKYLRLMISAETYRFNYLLRGNPTMRNCIKFHEMSKPQLFKQS